MRLEVNAVICRPMRIKGLDLQEFQANCGFLIITIQYCFNAVGVCRLSCAFESDYSGVCCKIRNENENYDEKCVIKFQLHLNRSRFRK